MSMFWFFISFLIKNIICFIQFGPSSNIYDSFFSFSLKIDTTRVYFNHLCCIAYSGVKRLCGSNFKHPSIKSINSGSNSPVRASRIGSDFMLALAGSRERLDLIKL